MSFMYLLVCSSDTSPSPAPEKQRPDLITVIRTATLISSDQVKPHQQGVGKIRKVTTGEEKWEEPGRARGSQGTALCGDNQNRPLLQRLERGHVVSPSFSPSSPHHRWIFALGVHTRACVPQDDFRFFSREYRLRQHFRISRSFLIRRSPCLIHNQLLPERPSL